jgi:hypothetical protein
LIRLFTTKLSPLGLTFFNSMLLMLRIYVFSFYHISHFLLNGPLKDENNDFLGFNLFYGFSTQYVSIISKASTLCSATVLSQEDPKFVDCILQGVKKGFFFISYAIILQSMWLVLLKLFSRIILVVKDKIL